MRALDPGSFGGALARSRIGAAEEEVAEQGGDIGICLASACCIWASEKLRPAWRRYLATALQYRHFAPAQIGADHQPA